MTPDTMGDINDTVRDEFMPELQERYPSLQIIKGGWEEQQAEFFAEVTRLFTLAMLTIYALLAVAFRSYSLPTIIMSAIPFAYMGAIFGHQMLGIPLDMFSFFGMGAAAGVVVNDNLVLIDYILKREEQGDDRFTAIISRKKSVQTNTTHHADDVRGAIPHYYRDITGRSLPKALSDIARVWCVLCLLREFDLGACALSDRR